MPPVPIPGRRRDSLPSQHPLTRADIDVVKAFLRNLPTEAPDAFVARGINPTDWPALLRAAVESLRGETAAATDEKRHFIEAVLTEGAGQGLFSSWVFEGATERYDYRVNLPDGTVVGIEAKGCPDGNNMGIWTRPPWAQEFVIWSQCPHSLVNQPGEGIWSGIANRLLPHIAAGRLPGVVDAVIFWDGRCGSAQRPCPKSHGLTTATASTGDVRAAATEIPSVQHPRTAGPGVDGDWLPPPCIFLMPRTRPEVIRNEEPTIHTVSSCKFADALFELTGVPATERSAHAHEARAKVRGTRAGPQIQVKIRSRCWEDGADRVVEGDWKRF